jgi:hypothetical protein
MSYFIDNTPKKDSYTKFNEPKNINNLIKSNTKNHNTNEYLEGYLIGSSFEELYTLPTQINGNVQLDEENNYVVVVKDKNCSKCSENKPRNNHKKKIDEHDEIEAIQNVNDDEADKYSIDDFKMNSMTRFYVGSLSVVGLLVFFRLMYKIK